MDAEERLKRFTPYIAKVFPETKSMNGIIESPLVRYSFHEAILRTEGATPILGRIIVKV